MAGIVLQSLMFSLQQRTLVIRRQDREDLPHLTISWNNLSGEIDVHLTPRRPAGDDDRESIAKVREADVRAYFESIGKELVELAKCSLLRILWGVRPSWLAKNYYYLVGPKKESIEKWLRRAAPKLRGRYRLDASILRKVPEHVLYYPSARRFAEFGQQGQIYAVRRKGHDKGHVLILTNLIWPEGSATWIAIDYGDMQKFTGDIKRLFARYLDSLISDKKKRIYEALHLKEIGW